MIAMINFKFLNIKSIFAINYSKFIFVLIQMHTYNKFVELIMYHQIKTQLQKLEKIEILQKQLKTITVNARYSVQRDELHTKIVLHTCKDSGKNTILPYKMNPRSYLQHRAHCSSE